MADELRRIAARRHWTRRDSGAGGGKRHAMKETQRELRILSPTGILGYGFPEASFVRGLERDLDLIAVDAGSTDPGPYYLGAGEPFTNRAGVHRDLRYLLRAAVSREIPLIVGSAGGSGAAPHVAWCRDIVEEVAREEGLTFRLGIIGADVAGATVLEALRSGHIEAVGGAPELTEEAIAESTHIVAQMGCEPIIDALDAGCDVILAGRAYDPAVFAAPPIRAGYDAALALHLGKILECAAIAATPGSGADCVLGTLEDDGFVLEAMNPERRFTSESTAAHTLYEKSDPYNLAGPGGTLHLDQCEFVELGDGRVRVRGTRFEPSEAYAVKLEGARRVGFRAACVAGVRDPVMIGQIDAVLGSVRDQVQGMLEGEEASGEVHFHVYGRDGVMGPLEPERDVPPHELGLVLETVAPTQAQANTLCSMMRSTLLHYGYPERISTAGNLAFPFSPSDIPMGAAYEFSLYHLMRTDPRVLFPLMLCDIGPDGGVP